MTRSVRKEQFSVQETDGCARAGHLSLPRGVVQTPVFMPVGTQASVKSLDPLDLVSGGTQIILANTYHLMLRPGADLIQQLGGLSQFMRWERPILTDSGGFQIFSLAANRRVTEEGVTFRSHIDGSLHELTPERAILLQCQFGSDISMALDVLAGFGADVAEQREATRLTHDWLPRNIAAFREQQELAGHGGLLFGICQGGFDTDRRIESAVVLGDSNVDGCAIGGLSVGEPKDIMAAMLSASVSALPADRPRYLMGVGSPEDLWNGVAVGVDMFDCVLPTRVARRGGLFTPDGRIDVAAARFRAADEPVDGTCDCYTCRSFSRAYLNHLFRAKELLAYRLASIHNIRFLHREMESMRAAIVDGTFESQRSRFLDRYQPANQAVAHEQRVKYRARLAQQATGTAL